MDIAVCILALEIRAAGGDPAIPEYRYAVMEVQAPPALLTSAGYRQFRRMVSSHEHGIYFVLPVVQELLDFAFRLIRLYHIDRQFSPKAPGFGTIHDILVHHVPG
jgi:hypothetical protein